MHFGIIRGDIERSREEVTRYIEDFISQKGREWDWDDFTSIPIRDPRLEEIRLRCISIDESHPPENESEWCSEAGRALLAQLLVDLDLDDA